MQYRDAVPRYFCTAVLPNSDNLSYKVVIANSVVLFSVKPNCEGVRMQFLVINLVILFSKMFSNNFFKNTTDSREIDRNSSRKVGNVFFFRDRNDTSYFKIIWKSL